MITMSKKQINSLKQVKNLLSEKCSASEAAQEIISIVTKNLKSRYKKQKKLYLSVYIFKGFCVKND